MEGRPEQISRPILQFRARSTDKLYNPDVADRQPVLCVEDNDENFALVQLVLESTGRWTVSRAADVEQAREAVARETPVAVLLDLDLPRISGLDFARELKASPEFKAIPIIVVSASVMRQEHARAREVGCEYFIEKPFDISVLRDTLAKAVDG